MDEERVRKNMGIAERIAKTAKLLTIPYHVSLALQPVPYNWATVFLGIEVVSMSGREGKLKTERQIVGC